MRAPPGFEFSCIEALKSHYKTDWHRYNLKRKARRLQRWREALRGRVLCSRLALRSRRLSPTSLARLLACQWSAWTCSSASRTTRRCRAARSAW